MGDRLAGRYEVVELLGQAAFSRAVQVRLRGEVGRVSRGQRRGVAWRGSGALSWDLSSALRLADSGRRG